MGRMNYERSKSREMARQAHYAHEADERALKFAPRLKPAPVKMTKEQLRNQAQAALAQYDGLKTVSLRCKSCGHRGTARVPVSAAPKFCCSSCGSNLVRIS